MSINPLSFLSDTQRMQTESRMEFALNQLVDKLEKVAESRDRPFVFMKAEDDILTADQAAGTIIIKGTPVPRGFKGVVEDFNVTFGTAAGEIKLIIVDPSGNKANTVLSGIQNNTSGVGATVLDEGEALGLEVVTQGASSTLGCYFSGKIQKVNGDNGI